MRASIVLLISILFLMVVGISPSAAVVPAADFVGTPTTGSVPMEVTFTDQSTGSPTGWAWFFGDETYNVPWTQMTAGAGWGPRYGHTSVVMPDGSIILMGGREYPDTRKNDVWRSTDNGATWTLVTASAEWAGRAGHTSVVMPDGSIVLMGGGFMNDVWRSTDDGASWKMMTANAEWKGREFFTSVVMPDGSIVLMGGYNGGYLNDVWRSTDNGASWMQMTASAEWTKRQILTSVVMPDGAILLGGSGGLGDVKNDVWRSTDNGATWTQVTASAEWDARYHHNSVVMPDGSIILMGGAAIAGLKNDVWRSIDNGATWAQITASAGWSARYSHSSVVMPDGSIILMGGGTDIDANSGYKNDVWRYQPVGSSEKNPSHTYTTPGIYSVALQVFNSEGYDSTLKTRYITATSSPVENVPVKIKIVPKTINQGNKGVFIAFVTLPEEYKGATIDMKTVSCAGAPAVRMMKNKKIQKNIGFVFKTSDLKNVQPGKKVTLTIKGELKNMGKTYTFTGSDVVNIINKRGWQPGDIKDVSKESDDQLFNKYSEDSQDVPKKTG